MTPPQPTVPWRGYVNMLVYDLPTPLDEQVADRLATELIRQRFFTHPVDDFYGAIVAALPSGERLAITGDHDEADVRALLSRVVVLLDARRPWPDAAYQALEAGQWAALRDAPLIGRLLLHRRHVEAQLNRGFTAIGSAEVLVLRLRTGQTVALRSGPSGVELLTEADPGPTVAAFRELTGLEIGT
jgi:hypothetical protein